MAHVGLTQDHPDEARTQHGDQSRRLRPVLILWAAWGSNPEPKDSRTDVVVVRG